MEILAKGIRNSEARKRIESLGNPNDEPRPQPRPEKPVKLNPIMVARSLRQTAMRGV